MLVFDGALCRHHHHPPTLKTSNALVFEGVYSVPPPPPPLSYLENEHPHSFSTVFIFLYIYNSLMYIIIINYCNNIYIYSWQNPAKPHRKPVPYSAQVVLQPKTPHRIHPHHYMSILGPSFKRVQKYFSADIPANRGPVRDSNPGAPWVRRREPVLSIKNLQTPGKG